MDTTSSYLEDNNNEEVGFNGRTLTFTLEKIKIWTIKWAFKNLNVIVFVLVVDMDLLQHKFQRVKESLKEVMY